MYLLSGEISYRVQGKDDVLDDVRLKTGESFRITPGTIHQMVALTDCDRDAVVAFIRRLYLAGVKDPKRLTFKGLQAMARS